MNNYKKSICVDLEHLPNRKMTRRYSYEIKKNKNKITEESDHSNLKNKFKKIDKNKFKNIPKNEKLMNLSTIVHNNKDNEEISKDKKYCYNILNNIILNDSRFANATNIKKRSKENNLKISSLIPISKKRFHKSKQKTINEKENIAFNILKKDIKKEIKKHSKRRVSLNDKKSVGSKISKHSKHSKHSKSSKKNQEKKFNSSHQILKVKTKKRPSSHNLGEFNEMENIKHILKDEVKSKKIPQKEENKKDEENNNINKKEERKENEEKENKINEKNNKKENINKEKTMVDINNVKTKNEYEIIKYSNKETKKKYKGFPFCCLTIKDDNSSDND